ncbi:MAG: hypothetical protein ACYTDW_06515, partial [Planctomycetota bacterium]
MPDRSGDALINVSDSGLANDGADYLIVNGSADGDIFLLRRNFVALLNDDDGDDGVIDHVERVNYDENINGRLIVSGHGGDDYFAVDDNSSITTLDGGAGSDTFQIGQLFNTPRADEDGFDASEYGIADDDQFETLESVAGYLSRGTSRPLTAYGGDGADIFSVYHNTAVLRLEGEAGNDEFIVRAFALIDVQPDDEQE